MVSLISIIKVPVYIAIAIHATRQCMSRLLSPSRYVSGEYFIGLYFMRYSGTDECKYTGYLVPVRWVHTPPSIFYIKQLRAIMLKNGCPCGRTVAERVTCCGPTVAYPNYSHYKNYLDSSGVPGLSQAYLNRISSVMDMCIDMASESTVPERK